jgi:hypothetical protein
MKYFCSVAFIVFFGCATPRLMNEREYQERPKLETSLFHGDQDFVTEDAVQKILSSKIQLPAKSKIAILRYEDPDDERYALTYYSYYYWRSEAYIKLHQQLVDTLQYLLLSSGRVSEATILPSMLIPKQPSVSMIRQAGVRLQANLVLVYRITSDVYYDYLLFTQDEIKAYSTCEVVVFDTRTGIIPFTTVVTRDILRKRLSSEVAREEAIKRVQKEASLLVMNTIGEELAVFLKSVE